MPLGSIGAVLLVLVIVFIFSRGWFHFIEGILSFTKRLFSKNTVPAPWHTLPSESDQEEKEDVEP